MQLSRRPVTIYSRFPAPKRRPLAVSSLALEKKKSGLVSTVKFDLVSRPFGLQTRDLVLHIIWPLLSLRKEEEAIGSFQ